MLTVIVAISALSSLWSQVCGGKEPTAVVGKHPAIKYSCKAQDLCLCGVSCTVDDDQLVTGVAPAPVVNGCKQRGCGLLGGVCPQPQQKATLQKPELDSQSGNQLDCFFSHFSCLFNQFHEIACDEIFFCTR